MVQFFRNVNIEVPYREIYRRLGFRKAKTEISADQQAQVEQYIAEGVDLVELQGCCLRLKISDNDGQQISFEDGTAFNGSGLAKLLLDSQEALLMGATAGQTIVDEINAGMRGTDMMRGVVLDAVASEMTDNVLDWLMTYQNRQLLRQARQLTKRRYSAGYGDFNLNNQQVFHRLLQMQELGVNITDSDILMPEKSVTAIAGIIKAG